MTLRRPWQFNGMPAPAGPEVYVRARERVAGHFRRMPGVAAIYEFGRAECPGISDLDVLVVFEDDARLRFGAQCGTEPFAPAVRQVLIHPPQFVPRSLWSRLPMLWNVGNLERVWGEELQPPRQSWPPRSRALELIKAAELMTTSLPVNLLRAPLQRRLHARMVLTKLRVLGHYAGKVAELTDRAVEGSGPFGDDVAELRSGWFTRQAAANLERLGELIDRAGLLLPPMAAALGEALPREFGGEWDDLQPARFVRTRGRTRIEVRFEPERKDGQWRMEGPDGLVVSYPASLAGPLRVAAGGGGPLAQMLRGHFTGTPLTPAEGTMHQSNQARNEHCRFLIRARIPGSKTHHFGFTSPDPRSRWELAWVRAVNAGRKFLGRR